MYTYSSFWFDEVGTIFLCVIIIHTIVCMFVVIWLIVAWYTSCAFYTSIIWLIQITTTMSLVYHIVKHVSQIYHGVIRLVTQYIVVGCYIYFWWWWWTNDIYLISSFCSRLDSTLIGCYRLHVQLWRGPPRDLTWPTFIGTESFCVSSNH